MRDTRSFLASAVLGFLMAVSSGSAQEQDQTLADIRQELTVLHVEVQRLKRELSTTGSPTGSLAGGTVLERVGAIEAELQRLTAQIEDLDIHIQNVVRDGTNRIGDLEFRLVELEGGDVTLLGETSTLGGEASGIAEGTATFAPAPIGSELAVGEAADFAAAQADLEAGSYQDAADKLAAFQSAYPGSPLGPEADFGRGKALDGLGNTRDAARAYLAAFTGAPTGDKAPDALFELGAALGRLDQVDQACVTLAEVAVRFPDSAAVASAESEARNLACP